MAQAQAPFPQLNLDEDERYPQTYDGSHHLYHHPHPVPVYDLYTGLSLPRPARTTSSVMATPAVPSMEPSVAAPPRPAPFVSECPAFSYTYDDGEGEDDDSLSFSGPSDDEDDEDETFPRPHYCKLLTEAEYQRQRHECTRQQLKQAGLYTKHRNHFWRQSVKESLSCVRLWVLFTKVFIALVVLAVPLLVGLYLADVPGQKADISMLPDLARRHERKAHTGGEGIFEAFLNRAIPLRWLGKAQKANNATAAAQVTTPGDQNAKEDTSVTAEGQEGKEEQTGEQETAANEIGVYEQPSFTFSVMPAMEGRNIFSFAYSAAADFFSKTFGWDPESNATDAS